MGYSTHPALVVENEDLLHRIRSALEEGRELRLAVQGNVSTEQYRLRRILASCDRHPEALRGEFLGLGDQVKLSVEGTTILIKAKGRTLNLIKARRTLTSEVKRISEYKGSMDQVSFYTGPDSPLNLEAALDAFLSIGWKLYPQTKTEDMEETSFVVERLSPSSPSEKGGFGKLG